ncbi:hypothetical protein O3G_MSEX013487 [Manduca sexta]|uniref:Uncharacterized protein n=1 Tax=Manduca sexta TaxID=7130 RepID=A0A921ZS65_MANSE|nr:hypothetical protein O3G_MSEX013487 [Manduca sexta]
MTVDTNEQWYSGVIKDLDAFCKLVDDKVEKEQQRLKACKKQNELEYKVLQEKKLNNDFTQRQAELNRHCTELDRICSTFESRLTIADNDKHRLENAKETYQLAKELTGIRLDFSAPSNIAKGCILFIYMLFH